MPYLLKPDETNTKILITFFVDKLSKKWDTWIDINYCNDMVIKLGMVHYTMLVQYGLEFDQSWDGFNILYKNIATHAMFLSAK